MSYKSRERMSEGKFIQSDLVAGQGGVNCKKATALGQMSSLLLVIHQPILSKDPKTFSSIT